MNRIIIDRKRRNTDIGRHLITMYGEVLYKKPRIIVELGIRNGVSTNILSKVAKKCNSRLVGIDTSDCSKSCDWDKWEFIQSDSVEFGKKWKKYCKEMVDVLLIDTYHTKPQVIKELNAWTDNMSDNALFIFHDTNPEWPKNVKLANEIGSVLDGINEFFELRISKNGNHNNIFYDDNYSYYITHHDYCEGMTYIRRIKR